MASSLVNLLLMITQVLALVRSQIYLPCDIQLVPGCECWNSDAPIVRCRNLNLTWVPQIPSNASHIHTLDLSHNQLTFLPGGVLSALTKLNTLILSYNQIRSIHQHAFQGKEQTLEQLDLSHNNLSYVPVQIGNMRQGSHRWKLHNLKLAANHIKAVENFAFYNLNNMRHLDLNANPIRRISKYAWDNMRQLTELRISFSRHSQFYVTYIPTHGIEKLVSLSMARAAPQFMAVIVQKWLVKFRMLKQLELADMRLNDHHLTANSLQNFSSTLTYLSLRNNQLRHIPGTTLSSLTALTTLNLSNNRIGKLGTKKGQKLPAQIQNLDLSSNRLRKVNPAAIARLKHGRKVDLSNNNIGSINLSPYWLLSLPRHIKLKLGSNPFRCSCPNIGIKTLIGLQLSRANGHLYMEEVQNSIRCASGGRYGKQLLKDVPKSEFECKKLKPLRKISNRKGEQAVVKKSSLSKKTTINYNNHLPNHHGGVLDKRSMRFEKPITRIYFNRNIHSLYLESEAEQDLPDEIAELLDIRRTALR